MDLSIAAFEFYISWSAFSFRVRKAKFYKDGFEITRRWTKTEFRCSQIRKVQLVRGFWLRDSIIISLKGDQESLTILTNPKNPTLKVKLYTWLKERVDESRAEASG